MQTQPLRLDDRRCLVERVDGPQGARCHVVHPFPRTLYQPALKRCQALMGFFSSVLETSMRRGFAFSATGMVNRNTPPL